MQYTNLKWQDGQPYSERFDDIYFSSETEKNGAGIDEFNHVFFKHNDLAERWAARDKFVIAELGLGSALNCLLTIKAWLKYCDESEAAGFTPKTLHYIAIERYPLSPQTIQQLLSHHDDLKPYSEVLLESYPPAVETTHIRHLFDNRVVIHYKFMDVMKALDSTRLNVDAWFLDGFSPANNPDMWSQQLFEKIAANSNAGSTCSTYTAAGFVKRNLMSAGFNVSKVKGFGKKREMLVAKLAAPQGDSCSDVVSSSERKTAEDFSYKESPWYRSNEDMIASASKRKGKKATIIGAGIAGLSTAHALVKRGWDITIIDKHDDVAGEASSNLAAIVYPRLSINNDTDSEFYIAAYCYALHFLQQLQKEIDVEKFWFGGGLLQMAEKSRVTEILNKFQFIESFAEIFNGELPCYKKNKEQTFLHFKDSGVVIPKRLCEALKKFCLMQGNNDKLHLLTAEISQVSFKDNTWQCFSNDTLINESEVLIIANGTQVNDLGLAVNFPVESVRGQMLELESTPDTANISKTINEHVYISPAIDGHHYLGGTYTRFSEDKIADEKDTSALLDSVENIYPQMFSKKSCSKAWVGVRSMSKDRAVIAGAIPDVKFFKEEYNDICDGNMKKRYRAGKYQSGLYISVAHGSRGFTQSFLCAELIAAQINAEPSPVSDKVLDSINPSRFIVNDLKRR